jgi:PAS domain S-box-containing protein
VIDLKIFEARPGISVVVRPDQPQYTIVAVSDDFIRTSGMIRSDVIGKGLFEVFPENPADPSSSGEDSLRASFDYILRYKEPHEMALFRYDIPHNGGFTEKYWKTYNLPVLDDKGEVSCIIHNAEDVTKSILAEQKEELHRQLESDYRTVKESEEELKQFKFIADHARDPFILMREDGTFAYLNTKALEAWGYSGEEMRTLRVPDVDPIYQEKEFAAIFARAQKEVLPQIETLHKRKDGHVFPVEVTMSGLLIGGKPHLFAVARDVTERNKSEKELKESKERFELVAKATQDAIWDWDLTTGLIWWNEGFKTLFGYRDEDIEPGVESWYNRVHPDERESVVGSIHGVIDNGGKHWSAEYRFLMKNGSYAVVFDRGYAIHDDEGRPIRMLGSMQDITERKQNDERFRTLANSISQLAWMADGEGWIYWYNQRFFDYTGTTLEEMQGWGWEKLHHPDYKQKVLSFVKEVWAKGEPWEFTMPLRGKDGNFRWFLSRAYPVKNAEGKVIQWIGTNTDITEQKQAEALLEQGVKERTRELESQKNLLDSILTNSSNGISVTEMIRDAEGKVVDASTILANDAAVHFTGLPREIYLTKTAKELDPNIFESPYGKMCLNTLVTGEPSFTQYYLEITGRWLELTISKMDGDHLIHIFTDVTPIKEAQLQLERSVEDLKRSNANLEEFAYAASHDMKEPIRKVHFFADRLKMELEEKLSESQKRLFERLESATRRMGALIDDLLDYSQATRGAIEPERVSLDEMVQLVLEDLELEIQQREAKVVVGHLPVITGNKRQLQQLFQNLVSNALKYNKAGVPPEVTINSREVKGREVEADFPIEDPQGSWHLMEVKDNGIGFRQEDAARIFNVFTRLHGHTEYRGTGVGLAIAQKVAENHGGFIRAKSVPGEGAVFKLLLPAG